MNDSLKVGKHIEDNKTYTLMELNLMFFPTLKRGDRVNLLRLTETGHVIYFSECLQKYAVELPPKKWVASGEQNDYRIVYCKREDMYYDPD